MLCYHFATIIYYIPKNSCSNFVSSFVISSFHEVIKETAELMWKGLKQGVKINVIIKNRAGENAPMIARLAAKRFLNLQIQG
jgi:hypothetical protein